MTIVCKWNSSWFSEGLYSFLLYLFDFQRAVISHSQHFSTRISCQLLDCSSNLLFISHGQNFEYSSTAKVQKLATYHEHIGFTNKGTIPWCQVTVGPKCGKDKLMQAVGRMRQLSKGQSLEFIASPEATGRWQCVKTHVVPLFCSHQVIAGIYGCE